MSFRQFEKYIHFYDYITNLFIAHKYHSRADFISDVELIANNCEQYNGVDSNFTKQAKLMVDFTSSTLSEVNQYNQYLITMQKL